MNGVLRWGERACCSYASCLLALLSGLPPQTGTNTISLLRASHYTTPYFDHRHASASIDVARRFF